MLLLFRTGYNRLDCTQCNLDVEDMRLEAEKALQGLFDAEVLVGLLKIVFFVGLNHQFV